MHLLGASFAFWGRTWLVGLVTSVVRLGHWSGVVQLSGGGVVGGVHRVRLVVQVGLLVSGCWVKCPPSL